MSSFFRLAPVFLALAVASGCGFQPVYAPPSAQGALSGGPVTISETPGRSGYELRRELQRLFANGAPGVGADGAELSIQLSRSFEEFANLRRDELSRRGSVLATARYRLNDATGRRLASGTARASIAFNDNPNAASDIAAQGALTELAARTLAREIWADVTRTLKQAEAGSAS